MSVLIKGGRVITAADDYVADVFVEDERISLIGESLDVAGRQRDRRAGKYVLPGCIDPHTHLDMPFGGTVTIDDVESGQAAAAFGGTTCHVDFCIQAQGRASPTRSTTGTAKAERQAGDRHRLPHGRHRPAGGRHARGARVAARRGRHLLQALHGLQGRADGRRRDALPDDGGRRRDRRARDGARRERRRDRRARQEGARRGARPSPSYHALTRPPETEGEATNRAIQLARVAGCAALRRPRLLQGVDRADRARAREGLGRLGRDVHAVLLRRLLVPRAAGLRGRQVRLHAAAARQGEPGARSGTRCARDIALGDLDRPLRLPLGRAEDARHATTSRRSRTAAPGSRTGCT